MSDWLVEGLIPKGHAVLLCGEPGSMKSWIVEDIAISVSTGTPVFGEFAVPQPNYVILIDDDTPTSILNQRLRRLALSKGIKFENITDIMVKSMTEFKLTKKSDVADLKLIADISSPNTTIIIDSLSTSSGDVKPNDTQQVTKLCDKWNELKEKGNTVIVVHHFSTKTPIGYIINPEDFAKRVMGNTQLVARSDCAIYVVKQFDKSNMTTRSTIYTDGKRSSLDMVKKVVVEVREPNDKSWARLRILEDGESMPSENAKRIIEYFTKHGLRNVSVEEILKKSKKGISEQDLRATLLELEYNNVLVRNIVKNVNGVFCYTINSDFNSSIAVTNEYWDELRKFS